MKKKHQLTLEIVLAAGAAGLAAASGGALVAAGVAGVAELLKEGLRWFRRNSVEGRIEAAIAEIERDDAVIRLIRKEIPERLSDESRRKYEAIIDNPIDAAGLTNSANSDQLIAKIVADLHETLDERFGAVLALLNERLPRLGGGPCQRAPRWPKPVGVACDRYWWRYKDGPPHLDDGFLIDPSGMAGQGLNPGLKPLSALDDVCCLILVGEPGSGKTVELQRACERSAEQAAANGDRVWWLDLREHGDERRLVSEVDRAFSDLQLTHNKLWIYFDSLDECRLRVKTVATILVNRLAEGLAAPDRLRVRIATRTADIPRQFEELRGSGNGNVDIYHLSPFRRRDVVEIVRASGADADAFMIEIIKSHLGPFAARPITLRLLNRLFRDGKLSVVGHSDLYRLGCEELCREASASRRDAGHERASSDREVLIAAETLAALVVFSNKLVVYAGDDRIVAASDDLVCLSSIAGLTVNGVRLSSLLLRETLGTGLFIGGQEEVYAFAHRTYAEFLSAQFVVENGLRPDSIFRLIMDSGDRNGQVIPQLVEVAAWIAGSVPAVFDALQESDPHALLASDVVRDNDETKRRVASRILDGVAEGRFPYQEVRFVTSYRNLACEGMAALLRPWITDKQRDSFARAVALEMATECSIPDLLDDYLAVIDRADEQSHLRALCARAVAHLRDPGARERLRPCALGRSDDVDDEIKGYALQALWPELLSTHELVGLLSDRRRPMLHGSYYAFLSELPGRAKPEDIPDLLGWVAGRGPSHTDDVGLARIADEIVDVAWRNVRKPGVARALAHTALARAEHHESILPKGDWAAAEVPVADDLDRQLVIREVVFHLTEWKREYDTLVWHRPELIHPRDLPFLLGLASEMGEMNRTPWAKLVRDAFTRSDGTLQDEIITLCDRIDELHVQFSYLIDPIELGSDLAARLEKDWSDQEDMRARFESEHEKARPSIDTRARTQAWLERAERGDSNGWWVLNRELTLEPTSTHYGDELEPDVTVLPGWKAADTETRNRFIDVARRYLEIQEAKPSEWLGQNKFYWPAMAGYRAIRLLWGSRSDLLDTLDAARWAAWAPIILGYPSGVGSSDHHVVQPKLVGIAYRHAPDEIIATLRACLEREIREAEFLPVLRKFAGTWDKRLADTLMSFVDREDVPPASQYELLSLMLSNRDDGARQFAKGLVDCCPAPTESDPPAPSETDPPWAG